MSTPSVKMEVEPTEDASAGQAMNKDSTGVQQEDSSKQEDSIKADNSFKADDSVKPGDPAKTEESAKPKNRVHWDAEADKALLMSMVILATSNGQDKKAGSVTTANGHTKTWNKIELPWQAVADIMSKLHGVELSKDSANQRYLKHLLPFFKERAAAFTDPPHADAATDDAASGPPAPKRKRKSKAKEAKTEDGGEPAAKKAKTAAGAEQDVDMADQ